MADRMVHVVDDDADFASALSRLLMRQGYHVRTYFDPAILLDSYGRSGTAACVLTDMMMGDMDGFQFADRLRQIDPSVAIIFMTAWPTAANAVDSIRRYSGIDYLEKPLDQERMLAAVAEGLTWSGRRHVSAARLVLLTQREREVFSLLVRGMSNKVIATQLGISPKTVEDHRASIMSKTGAASLADLIDLSASL